MYMLNQIMILLKEEKRILIPTTLKREKALMRKVIALKKDTIFTLVLTRLANLNNRRRVLQESELKLLDIITGLVLFLLALAVKEICYTFELTPI